MDGNPRRPSGAGQGVTDKEGWTAQEYDTVLPRLIPPCAVRSAVENNREGWQSREMNTLGSVPTS